MTTILAFDTTAGHCAVALRRGGRVAARRARPMVRGHAEALVPMILETLEAAGLGFAALDAVAVTTGPGAFTGIRIGLATARGIALAAGIPAIGVDAFAAVAAGIARDRAAGRALLVGIDTKRGDLYVQRFADDGAAWRADGAPAVLGVDAVAALAGGYVLVSGDAADAAAAAVRNAGGDAAADPAAGPPDPAVIAGLAEGILASGDPIPPPRPLYLRGPEARLPQRAAHLAP